MSLSIILLTATVGVPLACLCLYYRFAHGQNYEFKRNDLLVPLFGAVIQFLASSVPYDFMSRLPANFLHHSIGGGVVVAIITIYVQSRIWPKQHWFITGLLVLAVVNILGNANEVLELAGELATGVAYIANKLDTNIDLVANNVGAGLGFILVMAVRKLRKKL